MAAIVAMAATRTLTPSELGTYSPSASSAILAAYPPLTHAMKWEGERSAREVKNLGHAGVSSPVSSFGNSRVVTATPTADALIATSATSHQS